MTSVIFHIPQMDCPAEEKLIRNQLNAISGIAALDFNFIQQELKVTYQDIDVVTIQKALISIGMKAEIKNESYTKKSLDLLQTNINYRDWIILSISGALAMMKKRWKKLSSTMTF